MKDFFFHVSDRISAPLANLHAVWSVCYHLSMFSETWCKCWWQFQQGRVQSIWCWGSAGPHQLMLGEARCRRDPWQGQDSPLPGAEVDDQKAVILIGVDVMEEVEG